MSHTKLYLSWMQNTENTSKISYLPWSKAWLSQHQRLQNSYSLSGIMLRNGTPIYTQVSHKHGQYWKKYVHAPEWSKAQL